MSKGKLIIDDVIEYFSAIRREYPNITDSMLKDDGAIFYMNGNDGTDFDWDINGRCCEFFMFYKNSGNGFVKVIVTSEDVIYGFMYDDVDHAHGTRFESISLEDGDAQYLASLLLQEADDKDLFDESINEIDFDATLESDKEILPKERYKSYVDDYDEYDENDDYNDDFGGNDDDYGDGDWDNYD